VDNEFGVLDKSDLVMMIVDRQNRRLRSQTTILGRVDHHQVALVEHAEFVVHRAIRPAGVGPGSDTTTRLGPSTPMCSHSDEDPGPPLNANISGRAPPPLRSCRT